MVLNAILESFTLNFIFIVFNYLSNPGSIENNFLINYFENLDSSFDISIIVLSLFFLIFLLKNSVLVFFKWRESKYLANLRAELSKFFFKNYLSLPRIFHLRTNSFETVKNITIETEYVVSGIFAYPT